MTKTVDEWMRRVDNYASGVLHDICELGEDDETGRRAAIRSELEEVAADARRYHWLCTSPDATFVNFEGMCCTARPKADIDAAIDAAMQQAPEQDG